MESVAVPTQARGFTLIEMLVAMTVLGILLAIALPAYRSFILDARMTTQANDFLATLMFARAEAVKRNRTVTVCASSDGATCGGAWHAGWIVVDPGTTPGTPLVPLRVHAALDGGSTLTGLASLVYRPDGQASATTSYVLCNPDPAIEPGRDVAITLTGRAVVSNSGSCT